MLAAVILSAGESSRMGSPKALVPFRGRTFLEHLLDVVQQAKGQPAGQQSDTAAHSHGIGWTRVVLGAHSTEIREALGLDERTLVVNPNWQQGQLSSIQAAIRSLPEDETDGIILFLVDHPLIRPPLVDHLLAQFYNAAMAVPALPRAKVELPAIVLPTFHGRRGHPVIFPRRLYGELLAAPADMGARAIVWEHAHEILEVPTEDEGILLNLNDPETLRRALAGLDQSSTNRS